MELWRAETPAACGLHRGDPFVSQTDEGSLGKVGKDATSCVCLCYLGRLVVKIWNLGQEGFEHHTIQKATLAGPGHGPSLGGRIGFTKWAP